MRFLARSLTGLLMAALTLGLLAWAGQVVVGTLAARMNRDAPERPRQERVYAVAVLPARAARITPVITAFGEIRALRSVDLRAAAAGAVVEVSPAFEEGGIVARDAVLLRIDPADAETARDVAAADLGQARADLADAARMIDLRRDELAAAEDQARLRQTALARQRDLAGRGVGTDSAVEAAELAASAAAQTVLSRRQSLADAQARQSQAQIAVTRAIIGVEEAARRLADTTLRAPFDGALADVAVQEGALVGQNERLARLVDPRRLDVAFRLSTPQYVRLLDENGAILARPVTVRLDFLDVGLTAQGRITRDSPIVAEGETGREVFADLAEDAAAAGLRAGDFVAVEISEPPLDNVIRLPAAAVDADGTVLTLGADDRLEARKVTVLRRMGDDLIVAADGLDGAEVVAERTPLVGAGIRVRPVRRGAAAGAAEAPDGAEMVSLSATARARLIAAVERDAAMPDAAKARMIAQLNAGLVPRAVVDRLEQRRSGG
jgi:RND family efflux transporter MFP subunit